MSATGVGRCLFNKSHKALNTNYYYYRSWRKQIQMKPNINNLKNKTKNIPKIYYIVNTITLQRCIGMRKNNSFILYVKIFFLFVEKRQLLYNWLSMAWSWYRNQRDLYIDTVYLEPVPWLLKGSEDYCFKTWISSVMNAWPLKYKWHTRIILERLKLFPRINRTSCSCMSINIGLAFKKLNLE